MSETVEGLWKHGDRVRRLQELDAAVDRIRRQMRDLLSDLNALFGLTAGRGAAYQGSGGSVVRYWARIHAVGGRLAIRYEVGSRSRGNATTVSAISDGMAWSIRVADGKWTELVELDRRRRILNHQYSVVFSERKSLKRLHRDENELRRFLQESQFQVYR